MSNSDRVSAQKASESNREREQIQGSQKQKYLGHWSIEENMKYMTFLYKNRLKFSCKMKKKKIRLFEQMSNYIGSRSTIQCRTHHQKYELKLGTTKAILLSYKQQIGSQLFKMVVKNQNHEIKLQNYLTGIQQIQNSNKIQPRISQHQMGTQTDETPPRQEKDHIHQNKFSTDQVICFVYFPVIFLCSLPYPPRFCSALPNPAFLPEFKPIIYIFLYLCFN